MTQFAPIKGRLRELDALRGLAALGVVLWHYGSHFSAMPLKPLFAPFYNGGFLLVDFFFVLSGFVISRSFWKPPRQKGFRENVVARLARLYPLHLATLLATFFLIRMIPGGSMRPPFNLPTNDLKHFLLNLGLLNQSGLQDGWSFNIPAWSISTEFIVNITFLALIALGTRMRIACIMLATTALGLSALVNPLLSDNRLAGLLDLNLARCFIGFGVGVAIDFTLGRASPKWLNVNGAIYTWLGLLSLVALTGLMTFSQRHPHVTHYLVSILIAAGCVAFVPLSTGLRRFLGNRGLVWLGDISYSIYLTHFPLQIFLYLVSLHVGVNFDSPLVLTGHIVSIVFVSALTYELIEKPAQKYILGVRSVRNTSGTARSAARAK